MIGERVGRYRVELLLGKGGMGQVYRARDEELGRVVAIKVLAPGADPELAARMRQEARAASALSHPNAATVFDVGEHAGQPYIVMELCEGESARARVGRGGPLDVKVSILRQVADALAAAHDRGLVHRDVKPDNVVVSPSGAAKLLDFGVAKLEPHGLDPSSPTEPALAASLTKTGTSVGSPAYMAPEQLRGEPVDGRADQWSWGVTAFELLAGRLPWKNATSIYDLVGSILHEPALRLEDVAPDTPPALAAIVTRALSKERTARYASMRELLAELDSVALAQVVTPPRTVANPVHREAASAPTNRPIPWAAIVAILAVAISGALLIRELVRPPPGAAISGSAGRPTAGPDGTMKPAVGGLQGPVSASAMATGGAVEAPHPVVPCDEPAAGCSSGNAAWCDLAGKHLGCCAPGLVSTPEGRCACPPGGTTSKDQLDNGCAAAKVDLKDEVRTLMRGAFPKLEACYETALKKSPKLKGDVSLAFTLDTQGVLRKSSIAGSSAPDTEFQDCLLAELGRLTFSPPADGRGRVVYPLKFSPD